MENLNWKWHFQFKDPENFNSIAFLIEKYLIEYTNNATPAGVFIMLLWKKYNLMAYGEA